MVFGALAFLSLVVPASAADDACRTVLAGRIKACADACLAKARAAVDPEIRDRIKGYGCWNNCSKLEMFAGHTCPDAGHP